ncbi:STY4851/ECs_5259 family protein [Falsihalocynthiibacter arcticus]|uniref:STY4851/ECs_5259 family protein n=1 Tax=Falsihalocynthiibacter arcticus TaxID=1579316 RepID=UPI0012E7560F|nr:STY4851/ECs_5259 family protein [Falsihalocynthiibacter arcticus]
MYRVTEEQYDQMQLYCMTAEPQSSGLYAAIFTLWATEHFRSSYDGSHLTWRFLTDALEKNIEWSQLVETTTWGLRYWQRPLRKSDHKRLFLQSLLVEGGLPQEMLKPEGRYRSQILRLVGEAELRGIMAAEALPGLVRSVTSRWPEGFRQDDVSDLIVGFVLGLVNARQQIPPQIPRESSVVWLDGQRPNWRNELSINIGIDAAKSLLDEALKAERRVNRHNDFALRVLRKREDGDWSSFIEFPEKASVDRGIIPLSDPSIQAIRLRPTGPLSAALPGLLIRGDLSEDGSTWELRRTSGKRTVSVAWPVGESVRFGVLADGKVTQEISISGLEETSFDRPLAGIWVGRNKSDDMPDKLDYLADGRAATTASRLFVQSESDAEIACFDGMKIVDRTKFQNHSLVCVTGQGRIQCRTQSLSLKTSSDEELGAQIRALGKVALGVRTIGGDVVYKGWPRFFGSEAGSYGADISERNLRTVRPGGSWAPFSTSKELGGSTIGWELNGDVVARQRIWMLPHDFLVSFLEKGREKSVRLTGLPVGAQVSCGDSTGIVSESRCVELSLANLPEQASKTELDICAGDNRLRLVLDVWTKSGAIIGPDDCKLINRRTIARSKLNDWRLFNPDEVGGTLSARLRGAAGTSWPPVSFKVDREASLGAYSSFIKSALSLGGPDAEMDICILAHGRETPKLMIAQATSKLRVGTDSLSWEGCDLIQIKWQSLSDPEIRFEQNIGPSLRESLVPDHLDMSAGPWMILATAQGHEVMRPAILPVFSTEPAETKNAFSLDLQSAANATTRQQRVARISECLRHRVTIPTDPDWKRIELLIDSVSKVAEPAWIDQVQSLALTPDAATLILLRSEVDSQADRLALEEEAPFSWMTLPFGAWKRAAASCYADIQKILENSGLPTGTCNKIASDTVMSRCENIVSLRPELSAHLFFALLEIFSPVELVERGLAPPAQPLRALEEQAELAVKRRLFDRCNLLPNAPVGNWSVLERFDRESRSMLAAPIVAAELVLKERQDWSNVALALLQCRQIDPLYFEAALPAAIAVLFQRKTSND